MNRCDCCGTLLPLGESRCFLCTRSRGGAGRAVQDDGLPAVEILESVLRQHLGIPRGRAAIYIAGSPLDSLTMAQRIHDGLRAAPPLHDPSGPTDGD